MMPRMHGVFGGSEFNEKFTCEQLKSEHVKPCSMFARLQYPMLLM